MKYPHVEHRSWAWTATSAVGPCEPSYQRCAASSRPSSDSTRRRPRPSSKNAIWSTSSSPVASNPCTSSGSSARNGRMSPALRSPGAIRSAYGSHCGESTDAAPGTRLVSQTVASFCRAAARDADRPTPAEVGRGEAGEVVRRDAVAVHDHLEVVADAARLRQRRRGRRGRGRPPRAASRRPSAPARQRLQLVREAAQRATHRRGLLAVREVPRRRSSEALSSSLMTSSTMTTISSAGLRWAARLAATMDGAGSRTRTESAWAPRRPSTMPNSTRAPRLQRGRALGQRAGVQEHVGAPVVVGEEAEALLRVVEPDLAGGHGYSLRHGRASRARRTSLTGSATRFSHALKPGGSPTSRYATARVAGRRGRSRS